ncbi:hypothetical protein EsH8_VI_001093 [Colletotrichum jinshuiense]
MGPYYQHQPLSGPRAIRLVRLRAAADDDDAPLECEFVEASLDGKPAYAALSYTWGDEKPSVPMVVSAAAAPGSPRRQDSPAVLVTPNCADALRIWRRYSTLLWVDALSIDQASDAEKNIQVAMMSEIYRRANMAVIWLGREWAPEDIAPLRSGAMRCAWSLPNGIPGTRNVVGWVQNHAVKRAAKACDQQTLSDITRAPYWNRMWTLQEAAAVSAGVLCRSGALVSFYHLVECLRIHNWTRNPTVVPLLVFRRYLCALPRPTGAADAPGLPIGWNHLQPVLLMKASEPRDKVYALRALFPGALGGVAVRYDHPVEAVFRDATREFIVRFADLGILALVGGSRAPAGLPSWALDWASGVDTARFASFGYFAARASRASPPAYSFSDDSWRLRLRGAGVGRLSGHVSQEMPRWAPEQALEEFLTQIAGLGVSLGQIFSVFVTEIVEGAAAATEPGAGPAAADGVFRSVQQMVTWVLEAQPRGADPSAPGTIELLRRTDDAASMLEAFDASTFALSKMTLGLGWGRFFLTSDGRFGFGAADPGPGDLVCLFSGLKFPFVVRPRGASFVVVGPAIVDGVMDGELWPEDEGALTEWEFV